MKFNFLFPILSLCSLTAFGQSTKFSNTEVRADLETLHGSLKETHYNAFAYTDEHTFDSTYHALKLSMGKDSLTLLETTSLFQRLISKLNNGHTEIDFPAAAYTEYAYAGGTVFPLELAFEEGKALVRKNWSDNADLLPGTEVLSINGKDINSALASIYPQVSAERTYFKNAKIEVMSFPRLYWQVFGEQNVFELEVRSDNELKTVDINAVSVIEGYEMPRSEVLNAQMALNFIGTTAYMNPGNFGGDEDTYWRFIDSAFAAIRGSGSEDLIIDLRNNAGGNDAYSDHLVSYIADRPFHWYSSFKLRTSALLKDHVRANFDTTETYWNEVLTHANGEIYPYEFDAYSPQPEEKRFTGTVFVLVNRQTHSQSAVTAAQIQDLGSGIIVGEETGEYPSLMASQFQYTLPNTGIAVKVAKGHIVRVNGSTEAKGVIPDIYIRDHLLDEKDEVLETLLER